MMILGTKTGSVESKEFKLIHQNVRLIYILILFWKTKSLKTVITSDDIDVPGYDLPTKVDLLDTGAMYDYWSRNPDVITVNAIKIDKDNPTTVHGQFDSGADATIINLLIHLYDYRQYNTKSKCPVKLTSAVGTKDIHPLGECFLYMPVLHLPDFLRFAISIHLIFLLPLSVLEIFSRPPRIGTLDLVVKI